MVQILVFGLGLIVGSFLNVCIYRLPRKENIAWPASHCAQCKKPIAWFDNVPVLSYVWLKGKCRNCKASFSIQYPCVEVLTGLALCLSLQIQLPLPYQIMGGVIFCALIVMAFIDWQHQIIPDEISLGGIVIGFVFSGFFYEWHHATKLADSLISSGLGILIGGGFLLATGFLAELILKKEAMGGGDIKYLAAVGAFFGWPMALMTLFLGSVVGSAFGIMQRFTSSDELIPFGPYLAMGTVISMLWGNDIISWYFSSVLQ